MLCQVEIAAVVNALQLTPAKGVLILDIERGTGIVRQLLGTMRVEAQLVALDVEPQIPIVACLFPIFEPVRRALRFDEELHLHLLKLARAEDEIARGDLITERLTDLGDPEGDFLA